MEKKKTLLEYSCLINLKFKIEIIHSQVPFAFNFFDINPLYFKILKSSNCNIQNVKSKSHFKTRVNSR